MKVSRTFLGRPLAHRHCLKGATLRLPMLSTRPRQIFAGRIISSSFIRSGSETRSEEHTSELQSLMRISYAVFCLKNKNINTPLITHHMHYIPTAISDIDK